MKKSIILMVILAYPYISFSKEPLLTGEPNLYLNLEYGKIAWFDQEKQNSVYGIEFLKKHTLKWRLDTIFGVTASQENNKYIYFGIHKEWFLSDPVILSSSIGVGLFDNNEKIDLGHAIEFRTKITVAYRLKNNHRLGLSISHLSNSRLSNKNPGTEILSMNYIFPLKS